MEDLEWQIEEIKKLLAFENCGFFYCNFFRSNAMALACERYPEVRTWWDTRINSGDRRRYGYLEGQWKLVAARIDSLAAQRAIEGVFESR